MSRTSWVVLVADDSVPPDMDHDDGDVELVGSFDSQDDAMAWAEQEGAYICNVYPMGRRAPRVSDSI